ncbi:MAG: trigger factor [Lachnospiraceae bacterium]|nr:trigger factor [Lachnospiraceae bacterium]
MSVSVEKLENSMAVLTIEVSAEEVDKETNKVYNRQKSRMNVPGFRKGHAPRKMLEKMYGEDIFLMDAVNDLINSSYPGAVDECGEDVVSMPEIELVQAANGQPLVYKATVALKPPVSLGKYKGIEVEKKEVVVTDEDIDAELKREQEKNASTETITDRPVKDGDQIKLDFDGSVDGVPFDGGKAEDYDLKVGSGSFIPGFEEQLVGAEIGKEMEVHVTFPENYQAAELAGKPAVFKCTVKEIKEKILPEIDDTFADEVSEFSTLEEMKADIRTKIQARREQERRTEIETEVMEAVIADAQISIPEPMLKTQQERLVDEFAQMVSSQGIPFEQYLQYTGETREKMVEDRKEQAEKRIRSSLCLEQIVKEENITVSDEEYEEELKKQAEAYGMDLETVKHYYNGEAADRMKEDLAVQKALKLVADSAVEVEKKA